MLLKQTILTTFAALIIFTGSATTARADDQVDNPRYKFWANYKPESSETLAGTINSSQAQITMETKVTLKEVADDHLIVEIANKTTINGQDRDIAPITQTIKAKIAAKDIKAQDSEDVDAMGKTFKCEVDTVNFDLGALNPKAAGATAAMKIWTNKDVPGGVVKMQVKVHKPTTNPSATQDASLTYLLKSFDAK